MSEADPRRLGVHAAISVPGVPDEVPPEYVPRDVDAAESGVRAKVAAAAERGGFVLLVGGSSVGKTRCAAEAVRALLPDWWLVHPAGPDEVAALAAAPPPRTVVWLDELQRYLDGEHGLTGGVVRALLSAPDPVVIIGTLWPDRYAAYTTVPAPGGADPHAREREVLDLAAVIRIGAEFSPAEQDRARAAAARDRRLAVALGAAGYGLTQTLAAAPQLVARWEDAQAADPYAWAVLTAALDAARLGARAPLQRRPAARRGAGLLHQRPAGRGAGELVRAGPGLRHRASCTAPPPPWPRPGPAWARSPGTPRRTTCSSTPAGNAAPPACPPAPGTPSSATSAIPPTPPGSPTAPEAGCCTATPSRCTVTPPTPATRTPPGGWPTCWPSAATWRGAARPRRRRRRGRRRRLAELLAERGDLDELRARADAGDRYAARRLADLLAERGDLDGAARPGRRRRRGRRPAAGRAAGRARRPGRGRTDLRARADAGDRPAAGQLAGLLAGRGDLERAARPRRRRRRGRRRAAGRAAGRARRPGRAAAPGPTPATGTPPAAGRAAGRARRPGASCAPAPTPATGTPPRWPACWPSAATWTGCAPAPTPATGTPPGGWPSCWPSAATWTGCAPAPTPATRTPPAAGRAAGRARRPRPGRADPARPRRRRRRGRRRAASRGADAAGPRGRSGAAAPVRPDPGRVDCQRVKDDRCRVPTLRVIRGNRPLPLITPASYCTNDAPVRDLTPACYLR